MARARQRDPVRLAILIGSLAGLIALEIKTAGGSDLIQGYDVATERSVIAAN